MQQSKLIIFVLLVVFAAVIVPMVSAPAATETMSDTDSQTEVETDDAGMTAMSDTGEGSEDMTDQLQKSLNSNRYPSQSPDAGRRCLKRRRQLL